MPHRVTDSPAECGQGDRVDIGQRSGVSETRFSGTAYEVRGLRDQCEVAPVRLILRVSYGE
jgi:hypothetical protein